MGRILNKLFAISTTLVMLISVMNFTPIEANDSEEPTKHNQVEDNVFIGNSKLELGINEYGSFGSTQIAPDGYHSWTSGEIGLRSFPWSGTRDYFLPGSVDEGMLLIFKQGDTSYTSIATSAGVGYVTSNNISNNKTVDTSSGNLLQATTTWNVTNYEGLDFKQVVTVDGQSGVVEMKITIDNNSANDISNVDYYRGFDPDQHVTNFDSNNYFHIDDEGTVWIIAATNSNPTGAVSFEEFTEAAQSPFIFLARKSDDYKVVPVNQPVGWISANDFKEVTATSDYFKLENSKYIDHGIGLKFSIDSIPVGESVEIIYNMSLDSDIKSALETLGNGKVSKQPLSFVVPQDDELDLTLDLETLLPKGSKLAEYTFQWQSSDTLDGIYSNVIGNDALYLPSTAEVGTKYFRCVITKNDGTKIVTGVSRVTVIASIVKTYKLTFDGNTPSGEVVNVPNPQIVAEGKMPMLPFEPTLSGYSFEGWYTDKKTYTNQWDITKDALTENTTLYAKWEALPLDKAEDSVIKLDEESLNDDDKIVTNETVKATVQTFDKEKIAIDKKALADLNRLEQLFKASNAKLVVEAIIPECNEDIAEEDKIKVVESIPSGIAISIIGVNGEVKEDTFLKVNVEQLPYEDDGNTLVIDAKPMIKVGNSNYKLVLNSDIKAPITFKIYLPESNTAEFVDIEHILDDASSVIYEKVEVLVDEQSNRYINMTVTEFSIFKITEAIVEEAPATGVNTNGALYVLMIFISTRLLVTIGYRKKFNK